MVIRQDRSDLPRTAQGAKPDPMPRFAGLLADTWYRHWLAEGNDHKARAVDGTRIRGSWAGGCDRQLAYKVMGVEASDPITIADAWRFGLGQLVHEQYAEVFASLGTVEVEQPVDLRPEVDGSATGDIGLILDDRRIWLELKTTNGYAFKMMTSDFRGAAEGPKSDHVRQAALGAYAWNADEMVLIYLSLENLSPKVAAGLGVGELGRFAAEWSFGRDDIARIARAEHERMNHVLDVIDHHGLPARIIHDDQLPPESEVTDPTRGTTVSVQGLSSTWRCDYCSYRQRCVEDGA